METIEAILSNRIKSKLVALSLKSVQRNYLREARYLLKRWPEFKEPRHELVAWSMAKDFARKFGRHSYYEWAFVFGIPKSHTLLALPLRPKQVERSRRRSLIDTQMQTFGWALIAFILISTALGKI